jgi:ABC-type nitrate/sulfonate/bicarbonate transport system substrate-binding protein
MLRRRIIIVCGCVLLLVIAPLPVSGKTIRVAIPGQPYVVGFQVAKEKGYYRQENLDVELVQMPVGTGVKATLAGNVEFAAMGSALFSAILGGAPLRIIMSSFRRPLFIVFAKREIRDISQLKGIRMGVPAIGTAGHFMLVETLKKHGYDAGRDLSILGLGLTETLFQALVGGVIDAAILSPPYSFMAEDAGFREIVSFIDEDLIFPGGGIGAAEALLRSNPTLIERFTRASLKGHLYTRTIKSGTVPIISRHMGMKEAYANKYYSLIQRALTIDGTINSEEQRKAIEPALHLRGATEAPDLNRVFDFSSSRAAGAELKKTGWKP